MAVQSVAVQQRPRRPVEVRAAAAVEQPAVPLGEGAPLGEAAAGVSLLVAYYWTLTTNDAPGKIDMTLVW